MRRATIILALAAAGVTVAPAAAGAQTQPDEAAQQAVVAECWPTLAGNTTDALLEAVEAALNDLRRAVRLTTLRLADVANKKAPAGVATEGQSDSTPTKSTTNEGDDT